MNDVTMLHNPRCSKSRATLELLHNRGLQPRIIDYLQQPPTMAELEHMLQLLGMQPRELIRRGESVYAELNLDNPALDRAALIAAMIQHPILIQRPIVMANGKAAIGRPPEQVLEVL